jgi:preprotein translocase subunit SecA
MGQVEKAILLRTVDNLWREHIITVDQLRQVIHLRGYGQRDPLNEYKTEGYNLFESMVSRLRENTTSQLMRVEIQQGPPPTELPDEDHLPFMQAHHIDATTGDDDAVIPALFGAPDTLTAVAPTKPQRDPARPDTWGKVGRNDPCPCGSGKKYKHCHGAFV